MHSILLAVLGLMATSSLAVPGLAAQEGISAFEAINKLKSAPQGYSHIADDGVARAYDENDVVIDYIPLTNDQLKHLLSNLPEAWKSKADHLHAVFDNVDGRNVVDEEQLLNPPAELRISFDPPGPQSKRDVDSPLEATLEARDWYCRGQPCTRSPACQVLGCSSCSHIDAVIPGATGVCI